MTHVVFAWELNPLAPGAIQHNLAKVLLDRGFIVTFIMVGKYTVGIDPRVRLIQAPQWQTKHRSTAPCCYPEILLTKGYSESAHLSGLVKSWRDIFHFSTPDVLICENAPSALVAAYFESFKKIVIDDGCYTPVPGIVSYDMKPFQAKPHDRIDVSERRVLTTINTVLEEVGGGGVFLEYLGDLFNVNQTFIASLPELDPQRKNRVNSMYIGAAKCMSFSKGEALTWQQESADYRVIINFLKPNRHMYALLKVLALFEAEVVIVSPKGSEFSEGEFDSSSVRWVDNHSSIDTLLPDADLVICEGGDILVKSLSHGVATLLNPSSLQDVTLSRVAEDLGVSRTLRVTDDKRSIERKITLLLEEAIYMGNAQSIAEKGGALLRPDYGLKALFSSIENRG